MSENNCEKNNLINKIDNTKRLKKDLNFWSPLNNSSGLPNKISKCTWHSDDRETTPHSVREWRRTTKVLPDVLYAIGNTPIIKLNRIPQAEGLKCDMYAKCEFFNPGGSVKDRIGYRLVEDAEQQGLLKPGYTIIEPTSGNTGIGIALAAAVKGYRCVIVMSEKMSNEKVSVLTALGAEIVRTPVTAPSSSAEGMFGVTHKLKTEIPNSIILDQYSNPANPLAHYDTTAEEIYDQLDKKVDMIVMGAGTGGTVTGVGRKFKEISPDTVIVAVDPEGSILAQPETLNKTDVSFYEVEGIGYDFIPTVLDRLVVDKWIKTNDQESLPMARRLISEEGLLVGSSSGSAMVAAIKAAKDLDKGQKVVVIMPDSIRNYMTKFISDQWMEARLFKECVNPSNHWWWDITVSSIELKNVQTIGTSISCEKGLNIIKKIGADQIPVVDSNKSLAKKNLSKLTSEENYTGPLFIQFTEVNVSGIVGMVTVQNLLRKVVSENVQLSESIEKVITRIYPKVYKSATLGLVSRILEKESYVLILDKQGTGKSQIDKPIGILTASDLLQCISKEATTN